MTLFRESVVEGQRKQLYGKVTLHQPVAFGPLTAAAGLIVVVGFLFLATQGYSKRETVSGTVVPVGGTTGVFAPRSGVITSILASLGAQVEAGTPLYVVSGDTSGPKGDLTAAQRAQVVSRLAEINLQIQQAELRERDEAQRLHRRAKAISDDTLAIERSSAMQRQQMDLAESQLAQIEPLVRQGYISKIERDRRTQTALSQRQAVEDLDRQAQARAEEAADVMAQAKQLPSSLESETSQLRESRASLLQSLAELDVQSRVVVTSPIRGQVVAINAKPGEVASADQPVVSIAPRSSVLRAEVFIPTKAAGFVEVGQSVNVMVDAFPFQRFGSLPGRIVELHRAPISIPATSAQQPPMQAYRALVELKRTEFRTFGKLRKIQSGMQVTADVVTSKQTFLELMLDPLLASSRRAFAS
jgi:membrane fusion protein